MRLVSCGERIFVGASMMRLLNPFEVPTFEAVFANSHLNIVSQIREFALIVGASSADSHSALATVMLTQ